MNLLNYFNILTLNKSRQLRLWRAGLVSGLLIFLSLPSFSQTNYYSKSTGNLNAVGTWGLNPDGSGTSPTNFTTANRIFNIRNNANPTISANWTVSGLGSKIIVGNGTDACNFLMSFTVTATVDVSTNATLTINSAANPTINTLAAGSTVIFSRAGAQTIPVKAYANLVIGGISGSKTLAGSITVSGNFKKETSGSTFIQNSVATAYSITISGDLSITGGTYNFNSGTSPISLITLSGNFTNAGSIVTSGSLAANGQIIFTGSGSQTFLNTGTITNTNYTVNNTSTVQMLSNLVLQRGLTIKSGVLAVDGVLDAQSSIISEVGASGTANVQLNSGGTFKTANSAGISGTIPGTFTTKTFNAGANYEIQGAVTGSLPNTVMNNLTINNGGTTTTTGQALTINGGLYIAANCIFNVGTSAVGGILASTAGTGLLKTQAPVSALAPGKTWNFTVEYNATGAQSIIEGTYTDLTVAGTGTKTADAAFDVGGLLTINAGCILSMSAFQLNTVGSTAGSGTLITGNISTTPLPGGKTWNFDIEYNGSGAQGVVAGTYLKDLNLSGSGNKSMTGNITVQNCNFSGGTFTINKAGAGNALTVLGNFTQSGGMIDFNSFTSGASVLNLQGNLTQTAGFMITGGSGVNNGIINFSGAGTLLSPQVINISPTTTPTTNAIIPGSAGIPFIQIEVASGTVVQLDSDVQLNRADAPLQGIFTVKNGSTLIMQDKVISVNNAGTTGSGDFILETNSHLITNHASGINSTGATGAIQTTATTASRNFSSGANYQFNGISTGSFTTTPNSPEVHDLTIGNGTSLNSTLAGPLSVNGILTLGVNTTFSSGNDLTLISTATTFSSVAIIPASSIITGNVNVQTYFNGGLGMRGTRILSTSVNDLLLPGGSKFYQQLKNNIVITGPGGISNGFDMGNDVQPFGVTLTRYNEPAALSSVQFIPVPNLFDSSILLPGEAAFLFYRGDRSDYNPISPGTSPALWSDHVPESFSSIVAGPLNQGNISTTITNANNAGDTMNGYNVVGNPYPATIDWDKVHADNSADIANEIRIIKPGGGVMSRKKVGMTVTVVNGGDDLGSQYIQPNQGFYIRKTSMGSGSLNFNELHKETGGAPDRLLITPQNNSALRMGLLNVTFAPVHDDALQIYFNLRDAVNKDEAAIVFKEGFDANFDQIDAPYLSGSTVLLSSLSQDGKSNAINYMPQYGSISEIKLSVNAASTGLVTLNFTRVPNVPGIRAVLKDLYLNVSTTINSGLIYPFTIDKAISASFGPSRFLIAFEVESVPQNFNLSSFTLLKVNSTVSINWVTASEKNSVRFEVERSADGINFNKIGQKTGAINSDLPISYDLVDNSPLTGLNYYRIKQIYSNGQFSYSEIKSVNFTKPGNTLPKFTFKLYPNPAENFIQIDVKGVRTKLIIYDLFGRTLKSMDYNVNQSISMDISSLRPGLYFAELKDLTTNRPTDVVVFIKK